MDPLARVHLNGLRAVEAAGRLGSLSKAAESLGVTVGAVSQQIRKTEAQLGRALFVRTPAGLEPTEVGRTLLAGLGEGFRALSAAVATAAGPPDNALTVSVAPLLAARWLVPRLPAFLERHPGVDIRIDASLDYADLDGGAVDVALRVGRDPGPGVRADRLVAQRIFPVCSPSLAPRLREPADLAGVPVVRDHNSALSWSTWLGPAGLDETILRPGPTYSDAGLCLEAVIAGQGVMLAWPTLAGDALREGRVAAPFDRAEETGHHYFFVHSAARPLRPIEAAFRRFVTERIRADGAACPD